MQQPHFNKSKAEIWAQMAKHIGAQVNKDKFKVHTVLRYKADSWEVTLDQFYVNTGTQKIPYIRLRAPFINKDGLSFEIYKESLSSTFAKVFGMQDIIIGDKFFDDTYIVKGNDEEKVKRLFSDKHLLALIEKMPDLSFQIREDDGWFSESFTDGVNELYFIFEGEELSEKMLKDLFEIFTITLERLVQLDSAYEDNPDIKL